MRPADCGLFSYSALRPTNQIAVLRPPPPLVVSGRVSKHRQACPCACCVRGSGPTGFATRGRGSYSGDGGGSGAEGRTVKAEIERWKEERERERGNYENEIRDTVFGKDEVISDFQSRNVVWQMELLGFGITQLIKP